MPTRDALTRSETLAPGPRQTTACDHPLDAPTDATSTGEAGAVENLVRDQDEPEAGVGHYLLSEERPTAAFDAVERAIDLVCTIDGQIHGSFEVITEGEAALDRPPATVARGDDGLGRKSLLNHPSEALDEVAFEMHGVFFHVGF